MAPWSSVIGHNFIYPPDSISIGQCNYQKHFQSMLKMREAPPLCMTIFFVWYVFLPAVYVVETKDFMLFDLYKIKFKNVEKNEVCKDIKKNLENDFQII